VDALKTIRFRLTVHYDGSAFHGWQVQPDQRTVQGELESALSRLADRPRTVLGSGRTDTGVHATGQVASVDMPPSWTAARLRTSLNALLPKDVWIQAIERAADDFHPRYHALRRTYGYELGLEPESASPFHVRWCWPLAEPLDRELLERAAAVVPGEHCFEAFAKAGQPERGCRCQVEEAFWTATPLGVRFTITADRYLHHMVRYLVGSMVDVARGRRPLEDMARLVASDAEVVTSPPAPAQGLILHRVEYAGDEGSAPKENTETAHASPRSTSPA
jgi:tRNA pseudouridine38-40 synthase